MTPTIFRLIRMKLNEIKGDFITMKLSDLQHLKVQLTGPEQVDVYRNMIRSGEKIKPIQLLRTPEGELTLSDGNHRLQAYRDEKQTNIPVQILDVVFKDGKLSIA